MSDSQPIRIAPGPHSLFFLKSVIGFYTDPVRLFADLHKEYGDIVQLKGGPYCVHLITQPEHIKYVLQDNAKNYHLGGVFDETVPVVGRGLTTNNGPTWLRQRRMVQSAFHREIVDSFGDIIASSARVALEQWKDHTRFDRLINIDAEMLRLNHHILGKLLFSTNFADGDPFLAAFAIVRVISVNRVRSIVQLPVNRRFKQAVQTLDEFAYHQIDERRKGAVRTDMLSMLMNAKDEQTGEGMSDTELHDEIMTLFFAAYEDVANAVAWAWYLLAQNPVQENKLRAEVQNVLGQRPPTANDLHNLPYLSRVVNEVLRLYPPSWSILRDAVAEDEIGGFHIPAGSMVLFDGYLTHRLPAYWEDPERFDPERFLPERSAGRPRFAYIPFGGGPRQCIGNELALMEIKLILACMVQFYQFTLASKLPIRMNALSSLQPRGGVWVKLKIA